MALFNTNTLPIAADLTVLERTANSNFENQRRLNLLQTIVPYLLVITGVLLPVSIYFDFQSTGPFIGHTFDGTLRDGIVVLGCGIAYWAVRKKNSTLASLALFTSVTGVILIGLITDLIVFGPMSLGILPEFTLLTVPIATAGVLSGPRFIAATAILSSLFTYFVIAYAPARPSLSNFVHASDGSGIVAYTIPIVIQLALGIIVAAASYSLTRTQTELDATRVAYERERELDRLKNIFISNVNHELRTPIMTLQGYLSLANDMRSPDKSVQQQYLLNQGIDVLRNLANIVEKILDVRQVEASASNVKLEPVPVKNVVTNALSMLEPRKENEPERHLSLAIPDSMAVIADADMLRDVLVNLLTNACKYSPAGSSLEITARVLPTANANAKQEVQIAVRDYGMGIPPQQIPLLFERFVRLERDIASAIPGTGLGLAICKTYVEAMGGKITAQSSGHPGDGSTFTVTLPYAQTASVPTEASPIGGRI